MTSLPERERPEQERPEGQLLEVDFGSWTSLRHATSDTELSIRSTRSLYSPSPNRSSLSDFNAHDPQESPSSDTVNPDKVHVAEPILRLDARFERGDVPRVEKKHKAKKASNRSVSQEECFLSDLHPQEVPDLHQEPDKPEVGVLAVNNIKSVDEEISETSFRREDAHTRIQKAVNLVIEKQDNIFRKRRQARDMRDALNKQRDEETSLRANVVGGLNSMLAKGQSEDAVSFRNLLEAFQSFYDSYLKLENEYRYFELQLEQDEWELRENEQKIAYLLNKYPPLIAPDNYQQTYDISGGSPGSPTWTSSTEYEDLDPLTESYLSRLGDARIVRERLSDLYIQYIEACDQKKSRSLRGLTLDQPTQLFISTYDETRSSLEKELDFVEEDAALLRGKCEDQGLSLPEDTREGKAARLRLDLKKDIPRNRDLLWVSDLDDTGPFFETGMAQKTNGRKFINKWILHQLRHSCKEISRLKRNLQLESLSNTSPDISKSVLEYWFQDDTAASLLSRTSSATED